MFPLRDCFKVILSNVCKATSIVPGQSRSSAQETIIILSPSVVLFPIYPNVRDCDMEGTEDWARLS